MQKFLNFPPKPPQSTTYRKKQIPLPPPSSPPPFSRFASVTADLDAMAPWSDIRSLLKFSAVFRVILIIYGELQDSFMEVKYTDADYIVISDAASLVASGHSPYYRTDYRHSPFLAFLLLPNEFFHRSWGKFLFSSADLLVGYFIYYIQKMQQIPENLCNYSAMAWLFNPYTFIVGTRGNCEPIACAIILWIIVCLMKGNVLQSAFWYGLVVHFRIYPIIYFIPIFLVLDPNFIPSSRKPVLRNWREVLRELPEDGNGWFSPLHLLKTFFTWNRFIFALVSGLVSLLCTGMFYYFYGWEFIQQALLCHLTRTDPRPNFSVFFNDVFNDYIPVRDKLYSFSAQFLVQPLLILNFARDLPFCLFAQTVSFVFLNKVVTAQSFIRFFCLLPLIVPWSEMKLKWEGLVFTLLWIGLQINCLIWGFHNPLEFEGEYIHIHAWFANLFFVLSNMMLLLLLTSHHNGSSLFKVVENTNSKDVAKLE